MGITETILQRIQLFYQGYCGIQYYFQYDEKENKIIPIWVDAWDGNRPDFYGGPMDEAKEWTEKCGPLIHEQVENPYLMNESKESV